MIKTRDEFVAAVIAIAESAPRELSRDMGEALVGMGVNILEQLGISREDTANSIVDPRNDPARLS